MKKSIADLALYFIVLLYQHALAQWLQLLLSRLRSVCSVGDINSAHVPMHKVTQFSWTCVCHKLLLLLSGDNLVSIPHGLKSLKMPDITLAYSFFQVCCSWRMVRCFSVFSLLVYSQMILHHSLPTQGMCGLYSHSLPCVYSTHVAYLSLWKGAAASDTSPSDEKIQSLKLQNKVNYRYIKLLWVWIIPLL